jgi:lysozyme family protein
MAVYTYNNARRADLAKRWQGMKVLRQQAAIEREARAIIAHKKIYQQAEDATGVPYWLIGIIDMREGGESHLGTRHLHCGDPLTDYTHNVPAGRPKVGHGPPFTWLESAIDALKLKGFHKIAFWYIERALHELEPYNGLGYFNGPYEDKSQRQFPPQASPYIWSCTNQYDPPFGPGGKYTRDHWFEHDVVDQQIGCAPLIAAIARLDPTVIIEHDPGVTAASVAEKPAAAPAPTSDATKQVIVATATVATTAAAGAGAKAAHSYGVSLGWIALGVVALIVVVVIGMMLWAARKE